MLELFTSQGCSSCPAADSLFKSFVDRPGFVALSLSVDYWDHLGWKDTLASAKNTGRQKAYSKALGTGNVYTPQLVVNGAAHAIGSQRGEIEKAIVRTERDLSGRRIGVGASTDDKKIVIEIGGAPASASFGTASASGTVWLAVVEPKADVEIKRGENRGRNLTYYNVVREMSAIGMWSGKPMRIELLRSAVLAEGRKCAVLLQLGDTGRIVGAAWMSP